MYIFAPAERMKKTVECAKNATEWKKSAARHSKKLNDEKNNNIHIISDFRLCISPCAIRTFGCNIFRQKQL